MQEISTAHLKCFASSLKLNSVLAKNATLSFLFFVSRTTKSAYTTELLLGIIWLKQLFESHISMTPLWVKTDNNKAS